MAGILWYYALAILGVGLGVFATYKKRKETRISTFIVFYLFATSITWLAEFVVLGLFNSYAYKPGVFKDMWAEDILGHLLTNSTLWPGTATLVSAYNLGYGWMVLLTGGYLVIEYLFMRLGIYEQHWWRFYMTAITVFLFFLISKYWFKIIHQRPYGLPRWITFYFIAFVLIHLPFPLLSIFEKEHYMVPIFKDLYRSSAIFSLLYQLIESFLLVYFVCVLKKWYWKLMPFIIAIGVESILTKLRITIFLNGWNLFYTLLLSFLFLAAFILLEKYGLATDSDN
jgi:hypothetical protein